MSGLLLGLAAGLAAGAVLLLTPPQQEAMDPVRRALGSRARAHSGGPTIWDRLDRVMAPGALRADRLRLLQRSEAGFRRDQALWLAAAGACAGLILIRDGLTPPALFGAVMAVPAGLAAAEHALGRQAARQRERMRAQVPVVSELVALAVTAGEAPADALARASSACADPLAGHLTALGAEVRRGVPLATALAGTARLIDVAEFHRLADTLVAAQTRGVPLAGTLLEQVRDLRAAQQARLLEQAGRREIAMLVPVVFVILPCVVAVAVFPGATQILSLI